MFFLSPKSDSGDRSPWGGFWFNPVPWNGSGANVTPEVALQLTAVFACVRVLANGVSTLPFNLYTQRADGGKTPIKNHWLYRLFARRPNDFQNPAEFRAMMQGHLALRGNAFAVIYENSKGEVTDLIPIHPDRVTVELLDNASTNWRFRIKNSDGSVTIVNRQNMFHLKGLSGDGILGYSPIQVARAAIAGAIAAQNYGARYFENDAAPTGGWIEHPGNFKDKEAARLFRESWQEQQSGRNRGKLAVLEYGLKYHPGVAITNGDAQFIESRKYSVSDIARLFGVRPHKIGDLEKATFSNIEQQSIDSVNDDLMPWVICWEEAIRYNFLDPEDDTLQVEFPITALLRGDSAARGRYYHYGILDGWMTRNEARIAESLNPIAGLDEPLRPLNMIADSAADEEDEEVSDGEALPANANPNDPQPDQDQKPQQPGKSDSRLVALAGAAAERIARKECEMLAKFASRGTEKGAMDFLVAAYDKHAAFVATAFNVDIAAARTYCASQIAFVQVGESFSADEFSEIARCKLERLAIRGSI